MKNEATNTVEVPDWYAAAEPVLGPERLSALRTHIEAIGAEIRAAKATIDSRQAELDSVGQRVQEAVRLSLARDAEILRVLGVTPDAVAVSQVREAGRRMGAAAAEQRDQVVLDVLSRQPEPAAKKPTQSFGLWVSNLRRAAAKKNVELPAEIKPEYPWSDWHKGGETAADTVSLWEEFRDTQPGAGEEDGEQGGDEARPAGVKTGESAGESAGVDGGGDEEGGATFADYDPGHPWYYKLGGKPLPVDDIRPGPVLDSDLENVASGLGIAKAKDPAKREAKIRKALADHEVELAADAAKYRDLVARGVEALDERSRRQASDPSSSSPLDNALAMRHNHILYCRSQIAALQKMLGDANTKPDPADAAKVLILSPGRPLDADTTYEPFDLGCNAGEIAAAEQTDRVVAAAGKDEPALLTWVVRVEGTDGDRTDHVALAHPTEPRGTFTLRPLVPMGAIPTNTVAAADPYGGHKVAVGCREGLDLRQIGGPDDEILATDTTIAKSADPALPGGILEIGDLGGVTWAQILDTFAMNKIKRGDPAKVPAPVVIAGRSFLYMGLTSRGAGGAKVARLVEALPLAGLSPERVAELKEHPSGSFCGRSVVAPDGSLYVLAPESGDILVRPPAQEAKPVKGRRVAAAAK